MFFNQIFYLASYEDARRHLTKATNQTDIDSTDVENEQMGRGHRKKHTNRRYSPYKEVSAAAAADAEDSEDSSIGYYGPTQNTLPNIPIPAQLLDSSTMGLGIKSMLFLFNLIFNLFSICRMFQ